MSEDMTWSCFNLYLAACQHGFVYRTQFTQILMSGLLTIIRKNKAKSKEMRILFL